MWNHRVILKKEDGEVYFEIHEVYYNEDGTIWAITEESVKPFGDTAEEREAVGMKLMLTAFEEPVLVEDEIVFVEK